MRTSKLPRALSSLAIGGLCILTNGCGGSGGGSSSGEDLGGGRAYLVTAPVTHDSCGERLSAVQQRFVLRDGGSQGIQLDTSLVTFDLVSGEVGYEGGYAESNGDCAREYSVVWSDPDSDGSAVTLKSQTTCGTVACETEWRGQAVRAGAEEKEFLPRVRGEACNSVVPSVVGYRPSLFECNGNAAVLLGGNLRNNYSVVVRRDGQFNDRDPRNPSCGTNRCSPYKTQKRLELPEYQVNCLGDSGFSADYAPVNRISIKFTAQVQNANDTSQFEQYCLTDTTAELN